jgi:hypothetical protein
MSFVNVFLPTGCKNVKNITVKGDGNCFYRAICASRKGEDDDLGYKELRSAMHAEYVQNKAFYQMDRIRSIVECNSFEQTARELKTDGKWASYSFGLIYCNTTGRCLAIHSVTGLLDQDGMKCLSHNNATGFFYPTRLGPIKELPPESIDHIYWSTHNQGVHFNALLGINVVPKTLIPKQESPMCCLEESVVSEIKQICYNDYLQYESCTLIEKDDGKFEFEDITAPEQMAARNAQKYYDSLAESEIAATTVKEQTYSAQINNQIALPGTQCAADLVSAQEKTNKCLSSAYSSNAVIEELHSISRDMEAAFDLLKRVCVRQKHLFETSFIQMTAMKTTVKSSTKSTSKQRPD